MLSPGVAQFVARHCRSGGGLGTGTELQRQNQDPGRAEDAPNPSWRNDKFRPGLSPDGGARRRQCLRSGQVPNGLGPDDVELRNDRCVAGVQDFTRISHGRWQVAGRRCRKALRAWCRRDFTVPTGTPVMVAISANEKSSTKRNNRRVRCASGNWSRQRKNSFSCSARISHSTGSGWELSGAVSSQPGSSSAVSVGCCSTQLGDLAALDLRQEHV